MKKILWVTKIGALALFCFLPACETISEEQCKSGNWESIGQIDGSQGLSVSRFQSYVKKCGKSGVKPDYAAYKSGRKNGLKSYCNSEGYTAGSAGTESSNNAMCAGDLSAHYQAGRSTGLRSYCTYSKGRSFGAKGERSRADICPAGKAKADFNTGYAAGLKEFCAPDKAFHAGKSGKKFTVSLCPVGSRAAIRRAFETGKEVGVIEGEIEEAESQIASLEEKVLDTKVPNYEKRKMQLTVQELNRKIRRAERELYDLKRDF